MLVLNELGNVLLTFLSVYFSLPGKVFTIFFALIGCSFSIKAFGEVTRFPIVMKNRMDELKVTSQFGDEISEHTLRSLIGNEFFRATKNLQVKDTELKKSEFVLLLLHLMNKIDDKDVQLISGVFDQMDRDCSGVLDKDEIESQAVMAAEKRKERADEHARVETDQANSLAGQATGLISSLGGLVMDTGVSMLAKVGGAIFDSGENFSPFFHFFCV